MPSKQEPKELTNRKLKGYRFVLLHSLNVRHTTSAHRPRQVTVSVFSSKSQVGAWSGS